MTWNLFQARTSLSHSFPESYIQSCYVMPLCRAHSEETCWSFPPCNYFFLKQSLCLTHWQKKKKQNLHTSTLLALHSCQHEPAFAPDPLWTYFAYLDHVLTSLRGIPEPISNGSLIRFAEKIWTSTTILNYCRPFLLSFQSVHSILLPIQLGFHILFQLLTFRDGRMRGPWQRSSHCKFTWSSPALGWFTAVVVRKQQLILKFTMLTGKWMRRLLGLNMRRD